jgi:hypothetical protein
MPVLLWLLIVSVGAFAVLDLMVMVEPEDWARRLGAGAPALAALGRRRGRPRKFAEASRAVTLTLPESVIATLSAMHHDLSQAIVHLARRAVGKNRKAADLLVFGRRAVITVRPTPALERAGLQLVPLPDGRALIAFEDPTELSTLQLTIADALEDRAMTAGDRAVYEHLSDILREARQSRDVSVAPRRIIVLESTRRVRRRRKATAARKAQGISKSLRT